VGSAGFVLVAVAPNLVVAAAGACTASLFLAILTPGFATVSSLIVPPRARGFAFSVNDLWSLPGLAFVVIAARVGDVNGFRWGIASMIPVFLLGAYIIASAGGKVAADIRAAQMAALAHAEAKLARDQGRTKLLVCRGVNVSYGQVQVLFGVDLDVEEGEMVALLGTNGAGKSSLLNAIAGLVDPSGGAVVYDGRDITHAAPQYRLGRGIVLMPGGRATFPSLTVAENLRAAGWQSRRDTGALAAATADVLERFPRMRERLDQPAGNLSGGEQQMLGLGMAFLAEPKLLLIDELSLGLAPVIVEQLLDTVREIHARGTTIVLVEQSVSVVSAVAARAVFMEKGEVRFDGAATELLDRDDVLRSVFLHGAASALGGPGSTDRAERGARVIARDADPVLDVHGVARAFGGIKAVRGVSLHVQPGETVGLIGANGAGKTTLFDLISGYLDVDAGSIRLAGRDITRLRPDQRAGALLGRSFQDAALFGSMTVRETIATANDRGAPPRGSRRRADRAPRAHCIRGQVHR
jgi:branched-chain amino acid transport system ATP-binding protein